jgi:hypothetical protein
MPISPEEIDVAYRKLKSYVYYDKTDLRLRQRLAVFECHGNLQEKLNAVATVLNSENPVHHIEFQKWLTQIDYRVVPKRIKRGSRAASSDEGEDGKFITNVTSTSFTEIEKVNYFFEGPVELHLISVLWIMLEGRFLDAKLGPECCGSRLHPSLGNNSDQSTGLFRKYHEQYAKWRDNGIRKAKQILTEDRANVAILGLDIWEYFYRIRLDFDDVAKAIIQSQIDDGVIPHPLHAIRLTLCLKAVYETYNRAIYSSLAITHMNLAPQDIGLPIGLCTSLVLANWYLKDFDDAVKQIVRPAYYGRYVDDILLVIPNAQNPEKNEESPVPAFMNNLLVKAGLLCERMDYSYEIASRRGLFLQQSKCILQYFDSKHSIAGLEKFQKKLEENGSDFLLMPVDEADNSIEDVAYELLYEGSVNKFRSITGLAENRYELAKHLARQTILHLLTDDPPDPRVSLGLRKFFKGRNAIEFHDLWERVFTFFRISDDKSAANTFARHLGAEIKRVRSSFGDAIGKRLIHDLQQHLVLSRAMADALCEPSIGLSELIGDYPVEDFRNANLIRHHFVRLPLLNYTTFEGALSDREINAEVKSDNRKLALSPRYINFDECLLLAKSNSIDLENQNAYDWALNIYEIANRQEVSGVEWIEIKEDGDQSNG